MGWNEQLRAQHQNNNCQDRLVLRSAPHVLRRRRYSHAAWLKANGKPKIATSNFVCTSAHSEAGLGACIFTNLQGC